MAKRGFGLLEIVIATSLISGTLFSLAFVFLLANKLETRASNQVRANFLAEEGLEALRFLRDTSWSANFASLNTGTTYYPLFNSGGPSWSITTSNPGFIDGLYARSFTVASVNRDASDNIVSSGGTLDPNTKEFRVSVSWQERGVYSTTTVSTYLSDIFQN